MLIGYQTQQKRGARCYGLKKGENRVAGETGARGGEDLYAAAWWPNGPGRALVRGGGIVASSSSGREMLGGGCR